MAAVQRAGYIVRPVEHPLELGLSGLERRCLLKRICECHELVQLSLLGAASARDKARDLDDLIALQEALRAAELQIATAERCALGLLGVNPDE